LVEGGLDEVLQRALLTSLLLMEGGLDEVHHLDHPL
jgi:hypothetical protein